MNSPHLRTSCFLKQTGPIVADAEYLTQADDMLCGWLEDQCLTWIESPDARQYTGSNIRFANVVLYIYFQAVQWGRSG